MKADDKKIIEDSRIVSALEHAVKDALFFWSIPHEYAAFSWDGIEKLNMFLASVVDLASVFSNRPACRVAEIMFPIEDWRLMIPADEGSVIIDCRNVIHGDMSTLSVSVFSASADVPTFLIWDADPWMRSMLWTLSVVRIMRAEYGGSPRYADYEDSFAERTEMADAIRQRMGEWIPVVESVYGSLFGEKSKMPHRISVGVNEWNIKEGKIGLYKFPGEFPFGLMTVSPHAFCKDGKTEWVLVHELCHATIGEKKDEHGDMFQKMAQVLGIPEKYRD